MLQDHPREYGENAPVSAECHHGWGSSPRIRGECSIREHGQVINGIIPANTGRIAALSLSMKLMRDHPREYGENSPVTWKNQTHLGSSPRIRGECYWFMCWYRRGGIIPANTGRIAFHQRIIVLCGDHPREYGENTYLSTVEDVFKGSSPRIRGEFAAGYDTSFR